MDKHIDMNQEIQRILKVRDQDVCYQAICQGNPAALNKLASVREVIHIDPRREAPLGPRQVESLLRFTIERSVERALEDAEVDNLVYDQLGEHRILGRTKKKRGRREDINE